MLLAECQFRQHGPPPDSCSTIATLQHALQGQPGTAGLGLRRQATPRQATWTQMGMQMPHLQRWEKNTVRVYLSCKPSGASACGTADGCTSLPRNMKSQSVQQPASSLGALDAHALARVDTCHVDPTKSLIESPQNVTCSCRRPAAASRQPRTSTRPTCGQRGWHIRCARPAAASAVATLAGCRCPGRRTWRLGPCWAGAAASQVHLLLCAALILQSVS